MQAQAGRSSSSLCQEESESKDLAVVQSSSGPFFAVAGPRTETTLAFGPLLGRAVGCGVIFVTKSHGQFCVLPDGAPPNGEEKRGNTKRTKGQ